MERYGVDRRVSIKTVNKVKMTVVIFFMLLWCHNAANSNVIKKGAFLQLSTRRKKTLMKAISSYLPSCKEVTQARILLLGPVGSGKSSFISSVQSVFSGRVTNRAMVGSSSSSSFTKKVRMKH